MQAQGYTSRRNKQGSLFGCGVTESTNNMAFPL